MWSTAEAIREDKPGFHGYGSLSFLSQEKCNARTTVRKKQKQGQTYGQLCTTAPWCFTCRHQHKKKLFLTAWRSAGLAAVLYTCSTALVLWQYLQYGWAGLRFWPLLTCTSLTTPKGGQRCRMRHLLPERANCQLISAACLASEMKQVQAALWGTNKELTHKNPGKMEFAGVNLQICPINLEGLGSECCKNTHAQSRGPLPPVLQEKRNTLAFMLSWK